MPRQVWDPVPGLGRVLHDAWGALVVAAADMSRDEWRARASGAEVGRVPLRVRRAVEDAVRALAEARDELDAEYDREATRAAWRSGAAESDEEEGSECDR